MAHVHNPGGIFMNTTPARLRKSSYAVMMALGCIATTTLYAQDNSVDELQEVEEDVERVIVTGSRIKRAEFSSASPIQIVDGDLSRELGLFDAAELLQSSTQSSGLQIDNSFGGFVLDNGPGASTVGFRGLGAERTLLLINGRRMAPAGVGGAPVAPDLNLIPTIMVERIENLFDGASTTYGSDAVAGVSNLILRTDVEGFDLQGSVQKPSSGGAEESVLSVMWGKTFDNGYIAIGGEYFKRNSQTIAQNPYVSGCDEYYYETPAGDKLSQRRDLGPIPSTSACKLITTNRLLVPNFYGNIWRTNGSTNIGIPNFSETTVGLSADFSPRWFDGDSDMDGENDTVFVDSDGDGYLDLDIQDPFYNFSQSDYAQSGHFISPLTRHSLFANGQYNLQDNNDTTIYFEALYSRRSSDVFGTGSQFFADIPASSPHNPCGDFGVDCYGEDLNALDFFFGPTEVTPILYFNGDREYSEVDVYQYRTLAGIGGNIGALDNFGSGNWYYDTYFSYSTSKGESYLEGFGEEQVERSVNAVYNENNDIVCADQSDGCVPLDFSADRIWREGGAILSPKERSYLFLIREQETIVKQSVVSAFIGGDLFTLPWNEQIVPMVVGVEFRKDEIESNFNDVSSKGLLYAFAADEGAEGSRNFKEIFTEFELPLVRGKYLAEELTVTASGRWTDESFYDPATTYSLKMLYRPTESLTLRGTQGTSYRAPNLRERFLKGASGFAAIVDPCVVPPDARIASDPDDPSSPEVYDAAKDTRANYVIDSCSANGIDAKSLGLSSSGQGGFDESYRVEAVEGGTTDISEEKSKARTFGLIFEQPWFEGFDLTLSVTRFDIEVSNSIAEPSAAFSISQCYSNPDLPDGTSAFCSRLERDSDGLLSKADERFVNIGLLTARGADFNLLYESDFLLGDRNLNVVADIVATRNTESYFQIFNQEDDNVGEPASPKWRANARLSFGISDFRLNWITKFIQAGEQDILGDFEENAPPCSGLGVSCRPVAYTEDYIMHSVSLNYSIDNYSITGGLQNVFNKAPPKVDTDGVFGVVNTPLGVGYDLFGRTAYLSFGYTF